MRRIHQKIDLLAANFVIVLHAAVGSNEQPAHFAQVRRRAAAAKIRATRAFSVMTCRARLRGVRRNAVLDLVELCERDIAQALSRRFDLADCRHRFLAFRDSLAVGRCSQLVLHQRIHHDDADIARQLHCFALETAAIDLNRRSPSCPNTEAYWSMMPHGMPTNCDSARWHSFAISSFSMARATQAAPPPSPTSSAAEELRPAPPALRSRDKDRRRNLVNLRAPVRRPRPARNRPSRAPVEPRQFLLTGHSRSASRLRE